LSLLEWHAMNQYALLKSWKISISQIWKCMFQGICMSAL
jgi:hypothetical protein